MGRASRALKLKLGNFDVYRFLSADTWGKNSFFGCTGDVPTGWPVGADANCAILTKLG